MDRSLSQTISTARTPVAISLDETTLWLCSIPSPIGEEHAICDAVEERLSRLRLPSSIRRYGCSLVVPLVRKKDDGGKKRHHVALVGHLDTVRTENGPARIEDGRCHGAGAADMKSGLAVMIVLAETLADATSCDVTLVFYAREEGPYAENELGPVLEADPELRHVDLAVCLEPSDNRLQLGCCGSIHATVTFTGKTSHSARPWEGESAVSKAAPLIARLASLAPEPHTIDGLLFRTVTTITQVKDGGRGRNVVPDQLTLNLNHRFAPDTSLEQAQENVRALVGPDATITFTDLSPAAMPNAKHPLVEHLVKQGVRAIEPKQAWTDVARFATLGVPAVNFGPGENAQAHQKNESTDLTLVFQSYRLLVAWLSEMPPR